ncbi:hypothetical protein NBRC110019_21890 [Neptunitalea chrysea]|uniref:Hemolysin n=1 Tax=Neptunitalea chrysea TaxID=1647581 RepID=A0A9W6EUY1_9FLAO|nr:hemolysin family protein [Neptunitalea chrysea]GLB53149.1 hypothetical protein NBRC110019_21890 [Neptunitalea chrysea]
MALLIVYAVISIFFSFLCSILEAVLLSITPTFISIKKEEGKTYAHSLEQLKNDIDKPLISILTINTVAHTVGAILVGSQAQHIFGDGANAVGIVSAVMTFLILVVSEIIPKTIGASNWKKLAGFTTTALQIMIFPLKYTGILWLAQRITRLIGGSGHASMVSREDFSAMAEIAEKEGIFLESESKIIKNLISFNDILAKDVMTPRTVMKIANETHTIENFYQKNKTLRFSRIPVYHEDSDNIKGLVLKTDVLEALANGKGNNTLANIRRPILITNRTRPIPELFEELIQGKNHMALVIDEYGSVSGLVTQEDVIETLLGLEIMDESDSIEDLQQLARKNWERRARLLGMIEEENNGKS